MAWHLVFLLIYGLHQLDGFHAIEKLANEQTKATINNTTPSSKTTTKSEHSVHSSCVYGDRMCAATGQQSMRLHFHARHVLDHAVYSLHFILSLISLSFLSPSISLSLLKAGQKRAPFRAEYACHRVELKHIWIFILRIATNRHASSLVEFPTHRITNKRTVNWFDLIWFADC